MTVPETARNDFFPPLRSLIPLTLLTAAVAAGVTLMIDGRSPSRAGKPEDHAVPLNASALESAPGGRGIVESPPWGELEKVPIVTEKPDDFIDSTTVAGEASVWEFSGMDADGVRKLMEQAGLGSSVIEALMAPQVCRTEAGLVRIEPPDKVLAELPATSRAAIYKELSRTESNHYQMFPFTFRPGQAVQLLRGRVDAASAAMVERFLYRRGKAECLSDIGAVLRGIPDAAERRRLVKALTRQETLLLKLSIRPDTNIDRLISYWGYGGRRKDLEPLLRSLTQVPGGARIDAVHLIPPFARQRLYTFPEHVTTGQREYDCHFTCMNFFRVEPDMSFLNSDRVAEALRTAYVTIPGPARMGDVILLTRDGANVVHSCVYIADDVVFTKNGSNVLQPWTFMSMDELDIIYPSDEPYKIITYRLKSHNGD